MIRLSFLLMAAAACFLSLSARAQAHDPCFAAAAAKYHIDQQLLWSIAMTESSGRTSAIGRNYEKPAKSAAKKADNPFDKSASMASASTEKPRVLSEDIGVMQVNSSWLPMLAKHGITREKLLTDRCLNIDVGAWILAGTIAKLGSTWNAVGAYNAACVKLTPAECESARKRYTNKVWRWYSTSRPAPSHQPVEVAQAKPASVIFVTQEESN